MHRNELNVALMNGSRVRGGEGRFITFVFFFEDKKGDRFESFPVLHYLAFIKEEDALIEAELL